MSDPDNVVHMLDSMTVAGISRIKVEVSNAVEEGRAIITEDAMWEVLLPRGGSMTWKMQAKVNKLPFC